MNRFTDIDISNKELSPVYGHYVGELVSIEQALQPIKSQIKELARFIKIAKKYCHYPSEHGLSKDESASIYIYTMEWGETTLNRLLNKALRSENREELNIWYPYLKLFDTALDKLPGIKDIVWRGVPLDIGKNFTNNQILTWWTINSCSSSVSVIKNFLRQEKTVTLFSIEIVNGKRVVGYTERANQDEIILRMGTRFRVKSDPLEQSNNSSTVHLIEIDDDNDDDDDNKNDRQISSSMKNVHLTTTSSCKVPSETQYISRITNNTQWKRHAVTIAGGNGKGNQLNQLSNPQNFYIDNDHQSIYIADCLNHRIVEWKLNSKVGQIIAGGYGQGNQLNQLNEPTDVVVNKFNNSLIICDAGNRRVVEWPLQNGTNGKIAISNIDCRAPAIDKNGNIYISDCVKNEVRRWTKGEAISTIVAGGYGKGNQLNQLNCPNFIFVDQDDSIYISDYENHRIMRWMKDAKEGIIVAGGQGEGNQLTQLCYPSGVIVDHLGNIYVADEGNDRVICWPKGAKQGRSIVGGNGKGQLSKQLDCPLGLSFDRDDNLYVVDSGNDRIQKFIVK